MENSLEQLIAWREAAEEVTLGARELAERDRDYYDNKQWTAEEQEELRKRKQPLITINRIKRKIDFLTGLEKQQRTDPKAFPRNPQDEEAANAASDSIRYVEERNNFDEIASSVWENLLVEGFGGCEMGIKFKGDEPEIYINYVPWDRLFYDPYSMRKDFKDARYMGYEVWFDADYLLKKYPDAEEAIEQTMSSATTSDTYDDKPKYNVWADSKRKRVRVATIWYKEGDQWHWCVFTRGGKIKGGPSPYKTQDGESLRGMAMRSAYVDRDNNRYGVVREMISPQDEINKRRSKLLHQLNLRQTKGTKGAVTDVRKAKAELSKPDGHVEVIPGGEFDIINNSDQTAGQFNLLQHATQEIDLMGPNASMTGKADKGAESGRAIQAQQQGGMVELATLLDGYRMFKQEVYEMIWHLVQQYWTAEKWVRVTDQENNVKFVGLNRPVTIGEEMGLPEHVIRIKPELQQIARVENEVARLDVDILIEEAPDSLTIQHEEFQEMVSLVQAGVPIPPDLLIEMSQIRNKQAILDKMRGAEDPEAQAAQQAEMERQRQIEDALIQLNMEKEQRGIEKTAAETEKIKAETIETYADTAKTEHEIINPPTERVF